MATTLKNTDLTPRQIVEALDRYIVGQNAAKKAIAIAIRNRLRRLGLAPDLRDEVVPKNLILIGPTGVGKTEIARRIAMLLDAPFVKVEASKFTEVGYVGRDCESMVRDLVENAIGLVKRRSLKAVEAKAKARVEERILDALLPGGKKRKAASPAFGFGEEPGRFVNDQGIVQEEPAVPGEERKLTTREKFLQMLRDGKLEDREIEVRVQEGGGGSVEIFSNQGVEQMGVDLQKMFERLVPRKTCEKRLKVRDAREVLLQEEADKLVDKDSAIQEALRLAETSGIIFLDEIDKVCTSEGGGGGHGPNVSREGVQRDLLPIVEGSTVSTRYGHIKTDHILFVAAGAFHTAKPSDLIPELQGRFPIRVELDSLSKEDFVRILTEPKNALTKQYAELLRVDGVTIRFEEAAIESVARIAEDVNRRTQDLGARRLHTLFEKLLEDPLFDAPDHISGELTIDAEFVEEKLAKLVEDEDLARYIL